MHVLIINLPTAKQRLAFQERQMLRLGLNHEIVRAISTQHVNASAHHHLTLGWERPLSLNELACYLSHQKAWQRVMQLKKPALILEDDAFLATTTPTLLAELALQRGLDVVSLEATQQAQLLGQGFNLRSDYKLSAVHYDHVGSAAYVLWPHAAQQLHATAQQQLPMVTAAFLASLPQLRTYQLEPAIAVQLSHCEPHGIQQQLARVDENWSDPKYPRSYAKPLDRLRFLQRQWKKRAALRLQKTSLLGKAETRTVSARPEDFH